MHQCAPTIRSADNTDPEPVSRLSMMSVAGGGHRRLGAITIARLAAVILFCSLLSARRARNFIRYLPTNRPHNMNDAWALIPRTEGPDTQKMLWMEYKRLLSKHGVFPRLVTSHECQTKQMPRRS